jgi:hypothetical protein
VELQVPQESEEVPSPFDSTPDIPKTESFLLTSDAPHLGHSITVEVKTSFSKSSPQ